MLIDKTIYSIFKTGSRTYFYSSLFFPTKVRKDVFILYGFVRKADDYVDSTPQNKKGFYKFKKKYYEALNGNKSDDIVINSFLELKKEKEFKDKWIDSFLDSMESDLTKKNYYTIEETLEYIYGSAEVIGLMMAKILNLPKESFPYAKKLGRAMQYINFIRDIHEDIKLKRQYLPIEELNKFGLKSLRYEDIKNKKSSFKDFISEQIKKYCKWQTEAEKGYHYIPKRYLIPIKTASEMYKWTGKIISEKPMIIYEWKVKPMITKIITTTLKNTVQILLKKDQKKKCI